MSLPPPEKELKHIDTSSPKSKLSGETLEQPTQKMNRLYKKIALFLLSFVCFFVEQICELCGPFLFVSGLVWLLLPSLVIQLMHLTSAADVQTHNALVTLSNAIPVHAVIGGADLSGKKLVAWGIVFMLLAALCASLNSICIKED